MMKKRSSGLKLVLMSSAAAVALVGCGDPDVTGKPYRDLDACLADDAFTDAQCEETWEFVQAANAESAPRYDSQSLCEEQHGALACGAHNSGSSGYWSPFIQGYFVASLLDDAFDSRRARALYKARGGGYYTASGYKLKGDGRGKFGISSRSINTKPKAAKVQTRTSIAARGGFGKSFGSRSFGG